MRILKSTMRIAIVSVAVLILLGVLHNVGWAGEKDLQEQKKSLEIQIQNVVSEFQGIKVGYGRWLENLKLQHTLLTQELCKREGGQFIKPNPLRGALASCRKKIESEETED